MSIKDKKHIEPNLELIEIIKYAGKQIQHVLDTMKFQVLFSQKFGIIIPDPLAHYNSIIKHRSQKIVELMKHAISLLKSYSNDINPEVKELFYQIKDLHDDFLIMRSNLN